MNYPANGRNPDYASELKPIYPTSDFHSPNGVSKQDAANL